MRRVRPSSRLTCGRVAWKSTKPSGSMSPKRVAPQSRARYPPASVAPWPPSFQPRKAATSTGSRSVGRSRDPKLGTVHAVSLLAPPSGRGGRQSVHTTRDRERPDRRRPAARARARAPRAARSGTGSRRPPSGRGERRAARARYEDPGTAARLRASHQPTTSEPDPVHGGRANVHVDGVHDLDPEPANVLTTRVRARGRDDCAGDDEREANAATPAVASSRHAGEPTASPTPRSWLHASSATTDGNGDDDEREQEVRHHRERVQIEDDRQSRRAGSARACRGTRPAPRAGHPRAARRRAAPPARWPASAPCR